MSKESFITLTKRKIERMLSLVGSIIFRMTIQAFSGYYYRIEKRLKYKYDH